MEVLNDLDTQNQIVWLHFWKSIESLTNEEVLEWIEKYSEKFRTIWNSGEFNVWNIVKRLYN